MTIDELIKQLETVKSTHPEGGDATVCFESSHYLGGYSLTTDYIDINSIGTGESQIVLLREKNIS